LAATAASTWAPAGAMLKGRAARTAAAAVLADGRVLVVGGEFRTSGAEIYDPRKRAWTRAPDPPSGFETPVAAVRLGNSRVLLLAPGSRIQAGARPPTVTTFDPDLGWVPVPDPAGVGGSDFLVTPLDADNVLVAGGSDLAGPVAAATIYAARGGAWVPQLPMPIARSGGLAAPLGNGGALVAGGWGQGGPDVAPLDSAVVYAGAAGWHPAAPYPDLSAATQLLAVGPGRVLAVIGGAQPGIAVYDLASDTWTAAPAAPRAGLAPGVVRADGRVLFAGGLKEVTADAELFDPASNGWSGLQSMSEPRASPILVALADGGVLATGGVGTSGFLTSAEVFGGPAPPPGSAAATTPGGLPEPGWIGAGAGLLLLGLLGLVAGGRGGRGAGVIRGLGRLGLQVGGVIVLTWGLLAAAHLLVGFREQGNLAIPGFFNEPLGQVLWQATARSLVLVAYAAAGATVAGLGAAVAVVSLRERRLLGVELAGALLLVLPTFLLAILVQELQAFVFGKTGLVVAAGYGEVNSVQIFWAAVVLGIRPATYLYRHGRAVLERESGEDYVRTAEAKGLEWRLVVRRHLLRAGGSALLATWANSFRLMIGSLPLVEYFFGYPGLGRVLVQSIGIHFALKPTVIRGDIAIGLVVIMALILILVETVAGGLQRWLDPRLRAVRSAA
jgi:ABC-type dipeptide/oligopeptide/nickel transport system permease component